MTLGEEYPLEQERLRNLIQVYRTLGPVGHFGATAINIVLKRADEAAISGDLAAMMVSFNEMKGCE
jgi:hypothetical protein